MTSLIACLSSGKGTWAHVSKLIEEQEWDSIFLVTNDFGVQNFKPEKKVNYILIDSSKYLEEIVKDIADGGLFTILVNKSRDISVKKQMTVILRYINRKEEIIECFLGLVHVSNTSVLSLKLAIDSLFSKFGLSIHSLCGQGYDGVSNIK